MNEAQKARQLVGILTGAYTCTSCNKPSMAAIVNEGELQPACRDHGQAAERRGLRVIWSPPPRT